MRSISLEITFALAFNSLIFEVYNLVTYSYYRSFYLSLRYEYIVKARNLYLKKIGCSNDKIGKKGLQAVAQAIKGG